MNTDPTSSKLGEKPKGDPHHLDEVVVLEAHPSLRLWCMHAILTVIGLVGVFALAINLHFFEEAWRPLVIVTCIVLGYQYAHHATTRYTLTADELIGVRGVFSIKMTRLPLNRITNFDVRASFLDRLLGLRDVLVDTPGGVDYELRMRHLVRADSELLVHRLQSLIGKLR